MTFLQLVLGIDPFKLVRAHIRCILKSLLALAKVVQAVGYMMYINK